MCQIIFHRDQELCTCSGVMADDRSDCREVPHSHQFTNRSPVISVRRTIISANNRRLSFS